MTARRWMASAVGPSCCVRQTPSKSLKLRLPKIVLPTKSLVRRLQAAIASDASMGMRWFKPGRQ